MRLLIIGFLAILVPSLTAAQERDSVFSDYAAYEAFVDENVMKRDYITLVQFMGGRDEYTLLQLEGVQKSFDDILPLDFRHKTVFKSTDLGGGMMQEARAYWIGERYIYFYALIHQRKKDLVIVNFSINSSVSKIMAKF